MIKLKIKPLSVNKAWKGRRFKTDDYKLYEMQILSMLPLLSVPDKDLLLNLEFGFSSKLADIDNPVKLFTDCLQKKYGFNDKRITELQVKKRIVKKGEEYIRFEIK
jgi:Holliday junction resolvase RusA-like endonuclease